VRWFWDSAAQEWRPLVKTKQPQRAALTWKDIGIAVWPIVMVGLFWFGVRHFRKDDRRLSE
jgi:hypothetical protein